MVYPSYAQWRKDFAIILPLNLTIPKQRITAKSVGLGFNHFCAIGPTRLAVDTFNKVSAIHSSPMVDGRKSSGVQDVDSTPWVSVGFLKL